MAMLHGGQCKNSYESFGRDLSLNLKCTLHWWALCSQGWSISCNQPAVQVCDCKLAYTTLNHPVIVVSDLRMCIVNHILGVNFDKPCGDILGCQCIVSLCHRQVVSKVFTQTQKNTCSLDGVENISCKDTPLLLDVLGMLLNIVESCMVSQGRKVVRECMTIG